MTPRFVTERGARGWLRAAAVAALAAGSARGAATFDERFDAGGTTPWHVEATGPGAVELRRGTDGGIHIETEKGAGTAFAPWDAGAGPFEFTCDVELRRGPAQSWRLNGFLVALVSATNASRFAADDLAISLEVHQDGPVCALLRGGCWNAFKDNNPGKPVHQSLTPRFVLNRGGAGGRIASVDWPEKSVAGGGGRLRFHVARLDGRRIRFTLFHSADPWAPWWEAEASLPEAFANTPIRGVVVRALGLETPNPGRGVYTVAGAVRRLRGRPLAAGEAPRPEPFGEAAVPARYVLDPPAEARHPSLFFAAETLPVFRRRFAAPVLADYRAIVLRRADAAAAAATASNAAGEDLVAVATAIAGTGDATRYRAAFDRALDAALGRVFEPAAPNRPGRLLRHLDIDEFSVHRIEALAYAYDVCFEHLDPARRRQVAFQLNRALEYYLERMRVNDWWYANNPSNTIGVGSGASGLIALVLRAYRPDAANDAIRRATGAIRGGYRAVQPDGGCVEGGMYWNYGMSYPVLFAAALRHATGDDGGFFSAPRMTNAHRYVETILGGDGRFMTFNDTQPWLNGWTVAAAMGPRLDQPLLRWLADEIARQGAADETVPGEVSRPSYARTALLLRDERPGPAPFPGVPTLSRLESIQEGVLRSDGALRPRLVVGVKGNGKDHTHHAQADAGSFVFYARGEGFLIDPGYYQPGAAAHSLPLLGGDDGTAGGGERTPAPLGEAWERGALRTMTVDATAFHQARPGGKAVARCRRVAALAGDRAAVVLDDIAAAAGPLPVVARYQCAMAPAVELGAARARLPGRGTDVLVVLDGAAGAFEVEGPREFGKSWIFRKMAERGEIAWHTLAARAEADPARPLVTVLVPLAKDEAPPAVEVRRAAERVAVFVGGSAAVEFERRDGAWRTAPSP